MAYFLILVALFISVAAVQLGWVIRRRRLAERSWEDLMSRVERVDFRGIQAIAECYLQPDKDQLRIEPNEMWMMLGGIQGIRRLRSNAAAMLDLAVYAERWNWEHGPIVAEMIRRDAIRLKRAVFRAEVAFAYRFGFIHAPFYLQEVAASYYLIRRRLIGLYQESHAGLLPQLEAAL
jgi:hypothetical protein